MLSVLRAAKARQDVTAQPNRGRGLWLSAKLWQALSRHLEQQAAEVDSLHHTLLEKELDSEQLLKQLEAERLERNRAMDELQAQAVQLRAAVEQPLSELGELRNQMRTKQELWDKQKHDLESQMDRLMGVLRRMGLLADTEGQRLASAPLPPGTYDFAQLGSGLPGPEAQALQVREVEMVLAEARHQVESYRRQLAMRSVPAEELAFDMKRLKADNQRLVALLAKVPEYRALAAEMAAEAGVHYIPVEECLMIRGAVERLHPPLMDRPVQDVAGTELAGPGRRRDPDAGDPSLTLVLDEQYHWVPRQALETGAALMRRMLPTMPMSQLLVLVAELNKVWRDRERQRLAEVAAEHRKELRQLQHTFQQRAPYEAVVAGQKLNDIKRRIRAQAAQAAAQAANAKAEQRRAEDDSKVMLHAGLSSIQDLSRQVARLVARNKKLAGKASRQQRALSAAQQQQPFCSVCLNRLLLSDTLWPPGAGEFDLQRQQQLLQEQNRLDVAGDAPQAFTAAAPAVERDAAAAAEGARYVEGLYEDMDGYGGAPGPHLPGGAKGHDSYGSQRTGFPHLDVPTLNLSSRGIASQAAASTEPYNAGTVVPVNVVAPRPLQPPASPSAGRARKGAAAGAGPAGRTADLGIGGKRPALARLQLGPAFASFATAPSADPGDSGGPGFGADGAGAGAATELSTASLADWRAGASAPITVQVHVVGSSPQRPVMLHTGTQSSARGASPRGGSGDSGSEAPQMLKQARGVPVRVRVRFPRQDLALKEPAGAHP